MKVKKILKQMLPKSILSYRKKCVERNMMRRGSRETWMFAQKQRCRHHEKIVIVFMMYMPEVWNSFKSIYEYAVSDDRFDAYILAQPRLSTLGCEESEWKNEAYAYLSREYSSVINAYDQKKKEWFDLKELNPDYVIYARPYCPEYYNLYRPEKVREYSKVCFTSYGYDMTNDKVTSHIYSGDFLRYCSVVFAPSRTIAEMLENKYMYEIKKGYLKVANLGFARFDLLQDKNVGTQSNGRVKILWTPRWTSEDDLDHMKSNFLKFKDKFIAFIDAHTDYELVIRPHPLMFANYIQKGIMSEQEVQDLLENCSRQERIRFDFEKDYLKEVKTTDLFVSDFTSLLIEFFATGNPVIYCDSTENFFEECKEIIPFMYKAEEWDEVECLLVEMREDIKRKSVDRSNFRIFPDNIGRIGMDILDYLANDIKGRNKKDER